MNPHALAGTSPSSWRVYLFRHSDVAFDDRHRPSMRGVTLARAVPILRTGSRRSRDDLAWQAIEIRPGSTKVALARPPARRIATLPGWRPESGAEPRKFDSVRVPERQPPEVEVVLSATWIESIAKVPSRRGL